MKSYVLRLIIVLLYIVLAFALSNLATFLFIKLGLIPIGSGGLASVHSEHLFYLILVQLVVFGLLGILLLKVFSLPRFPFLKGESVSLKDFLLAFAGLLGVNLVASLVVTITGVEVRQFEGLSKEVLKQNPLFFLAAVALLAPIYEEFVFRGIVLRNLWGNSRVVQVVAILLSSLVFSLMHVEQNVDGSGYNFSAVFPVFLLALYLSFLAIWKKSLRLSISVHMAQNILAGIAFLYLDLPV